MSELNERSENFENEEIKQNMTSNSDDKKKKIFKEVYDWLESAIMAVIFVVLLFTFVGRTSVVSGQSMIQTLQNGEMLLISRLGGSFEQGDIVVATKPYSHNEPIIKRVIATEGQTVDIDFNKGLVYVNGVVLDEPYVNTPTNRRYDQRFPVIVPEGHVFLLGDNRNGSYDSRAEEIGFVDERYIMGKAYYRVLPFSRFSTLYDK